jgi:hypothetical protein
MRETTSAAANAMYFTISILSLILLRVRNELPHHVAG